MHLEYTTRPQRRGNQSVDSLEGLTAWATEGTGMFDHVRNF